MPLALIGALLLVCKMAAWGPVADWSWWIVLAPFGLAAAWWQFSDATGLTRRKAMDKMEQRKADRRDRAMAALGLGQGRGRPAKPAREDAARAVEPPRADQAPAKDAKPRRDAPGQR
jgi:small Trp-rich protein